MTEKRQSWFEWLIGLFNVETVHHRTCRLCHKRILKTHKYHHVKVGPFWVDKVEHRSCSNPTLETPYQLSRRFMDELPFDDDLSFVDGAIYPSYKDVHQEKIQ